MLALALFVGLPILEILLLIQAGAAFGFWWTVAWIFASAIIGIVLMRQQGLAAIHRAQEAQDAGEVPVGAILTGIRLAFAGVFMIIPGFITDAFGLLLLLPWTGNALGQTMAGRVHMRSAWMGGTRYRQNDPNAPAGSQTVDADFEVVRRDEGKPPAKQDEDASDRPPPQIESNPWNRRS